MKKGFTFLEITISVVVIGIVSAIAVVGYHNLVEKAMAAQCKLNMARILNVVEIFGQETGRLPFDAELNYATLGKYGIDQKAFICPKAATDPTWDPSWPYYTLTWGGTYPDGTPFPAPSGLSWEEYQALYSSNIPVIAESSIVHQVGMPGFPDYSVSYSYTKGHEAVVSAWGSP